MTRPFPAPPLDPDRDAAPPPRPAPAAVPPARSATAAPTVSVVVPARNEETAIERVLAALLAQDYPSERVDIVVVDNLSTDRTAELARAADERVAVHRSAGTIGALRNLGVERSAGRIIAFIDADCIAPPDWLARSVATLEADPDTAIVSAVIALEDERTAPWVERYWIAQLSERYADGLTPVRTISSFCFCVRREDLLAVGGFDASLATCEDVDLGHRMSDSGRGIVMDKRLRTVHLGNAKTLGRFFLRQLWQGGSNLQNARGRGFDASELAGLAAPALFVALVAAATVLVAFGRLAIALGCLLAALALPLAITLRKGLARGAVDLAAWMTIWSAYLLARGLGLFVRIGRTRR